MKILNSNKCETLEIIMSKWVVRFLSIFRGKSVCIYSLQDQFFRLVLFGHKSF